MSLLSRLHETIRSFAIARFLLFYILALNTLLRIVLLIYTHSKNQLRKMSAPQISDAGTRRKSMAIGIELIN